MKKWWENVKNKPDRWIFLSVLSGFIAMLLPILLLAFYAVPGCDDYTYGVGTHAAWLNTGRLSEVFKAAVNTTINSWGEWQGTYSSIFFMTLSPGILNEKWYFLTTFLMVGMLSGSIWALLNVIFKKYIKNTTASQRGICILILVFLSLQTMVSPSDGLYWYNGALHYVFMESVLFFQAAVLLAYLKAIKKGEKILLLLVSAGLAVILGGANLITGLSSCILMVFLVIYLFWKKNKAKWQVLLPLILNLTGFAVNVCAPGNYVREGTAEGMGAVSAVLLSFYWAVVFMTEWMEPLVLVGFLFLCPVMWKMCKKNGVYLCHPAFLGVISYCVFAAMFTPTLFATSSEGPDRCKNIMRIALYMLLFLNLLNGFGYISQKEKGIMREWMEMLEKSYSKFLAGMLGVLVIIFLFAADKNTFTSVSALRSLVNGEAKVYYEENQERLELYRDPDIKDVVVSPLTAKPHLLYKVDVGNEGSPDYWISIALCDYYGKRSVHLEE